MLGNLCIYPVSEHPFLCCRLSVPNAKLWWI